MQTENKPRILVVDDDEYWRQCLADLLSYEGYAVSTAKDGVQAMEQAEKAAFHLAIVDLKMPKMDGVEVTRKLKRYDPGMEVIVLTGFGTVESAVEVMKMGAFDYLTKPCDTEETKIVVRNALRHRAMVDENRTLRRQLKVCEELEPVIGKSKKMREVYERVKSVADTDLTVLIEGESGVGKELVADAIHYKSMRGKNPFIQVNCATFTETILESELFGHVKGAFTGAISNKRGLFEAADTGTLLLDEVADLGKSVQAQLLRVIERKEFMRVGDTNTTKVDVRIIVSTNKNLSNCVEAGSFREDLFYRLSVYPISIPPLRERREDIPLFVSHFLKKYNRSLGKAFKEVTKDALDLLISYDWPGNVRELENIMARAIAERNDTILTEDDFSDYILAPVKRTSTFAEAKRQVLEGFEKKYLVEIMRNNKGNITRSARQAGMDRKNLSEKLKYYSIDRKQFL
jgi:DNA-binding NtrC family response regulator